MTASPQKRRHFFGVGLPLLGIIFSTRFVIDVSTHLIFTFVPQLANGLGVSLAGFGWLMFFRAMAGITGPLFGIAADKFGRRRVMAAGLLAQAAAAAGLALAQGWWALLPFGLSGLSLAIFIPAQQAYTSEQAPPEKRGRVMGTIELSWSCTGIFASPVIGWLMNGWGWRAPLLILSGLYLAATAVAWNLPAVAERHTQQARLSRSEIGRLLLSPNVLASVATAFLVYIAVTCFLTISGVWLAADFGLNAAAIGAAATAVGVAEFAGAGASSLFIDRIGKRRGNGLALLLLALAFAALPLLPQRVSAALAALAVLGLLFQFVIVSLIPLYAEQSAEARGTVLALVFSGIGLGASVGPPLTAVLWEHFHTTGVAVVGATCLLLAMALVGLFLQETAVGETIIPL